MTTSSDDQTFDRLLHHLKQTRGFDFDAYKRTTLMRRVSRRMQSLAVQSYDEYLDYLQVHQDEFNALFNSILINVTSFFRDQEVWDYLRDEILPALLERANGREPIRVWSAGCASGQEPFSLAMLLAERVGLEALRERVKIYATDADEGALNEARAATYSPRAVESVPAEYAEKYLEPLGPNYVVNRELRRAVIFGRHDLSNDAPISRVDLLMCRNTLMYFNVDAQSRILGRFAFSAGPGGFIVLGRAEMLFSHNASFVPVDLKRRIFRSAGRSTERGRLMVLAQAGREVLEGPPLHDPPVPEHRLRELTFETDPVAQVVLDPRGALVAVNAPLRARFGLAAGDIGRPIQDLELSYRPAEIRRALERVLSGDNQEIRLSDIPWAVDGSLHHFDIVISPLVDSEGLLHGVRLAFHDVTQVKALQLQLQHLQQELETAYEELQSTNEELETTNEELQSTVEELETTNEELQSTNEELETMNEELQSTNEELQTMNEELRTRSTDLNSANAFLESVFASLGSAVIVLDRDLRIMVWNDRATDLWGVRQDEVHHTNFLSLDIGLAVSELLSPLKQVLRDGTDAIELVMPATSRRGRPIECRLGISPLRRADRSVGGVILIMEEIVGEKTA